MLERMGRGLRILVLLTNLTLVISLYITDNFHIVLLVNNNLLTKFVTYILQILVTMSKLLLDLVTLPPSLQLQTPTTRSEGSWTH
jgi:hypothetical protein